MLRTRSRARRNHTQLQQIVGTIRQTISDTTNGVKILKQSTLHAESNDNKRDIESTKRSSGLCGLSHTDLSDIQLRARHYLLKYKILDEPEISFSLVNIILQERRRLLEESSVSQAQNKPQQLLRSVKPPGQLLPPVHSQLRATTIHESRQEVVDLARWLDGRLESLRKSESITINDILTYKQTVLNLGLGEIIRMVAVTCKERASLLRHVWDSTFEIFQQVVLILTRHVDEQQRNRISSEQSLNLLFEERLKNERDRHKCLHQQHLLMLDHFKSLIIQTRRLRKEKKEMELKYRLLEYSLESYREGYEVALQMALQSGDGNIVCWAQKILGKLVQEKRRKRKKFHRVVQDQLVYRKSVEVVWEWLKHHTESLDEFALDRYANINFVDMYNQDREEELQLLATKDNAKRHLKRGGNGEEEEDSATKSQKGVAHQQNEIGVNINSNLRNKDFIFDESQKQINIYDYFKLEDIGTSMGIVLVDCAAGQPVQLANKSIQTWSIKTCDATTMTDQSLYPITHQTGKLELGKHKQRREGMHTVVGKNRSINQTDQLSGNVSISLKSVSNKKDLSKKNKKLRLNVSSSRSRSRSRTKKSNIGPKLKKNNVKVTRKYHRRRREDTNFLPVARSGSTAFIAYDLDVKPRVMHADLQLNKFEEVFEQERERMAKQPQQFIRALHERRSFANFKEVEYGSYCNYQRCVQKWAVLKKDDRPPHNSFNAYNQVSRKLKQYFDKAAVNSNIMKKKIFRQNTQIFLNVAGSVHLAAVRDQKASSTLGALNKILSSLLIEQVKQAKKEKEDKQEKQGDRFYYPLNALYVDKFINTYGLKEIAEKNMVSTLRNIIGLTHRSEKMRLFAILLGVYDRNVGGDQLQLYVRSLVYFDTTGKVALQMRDFNIERLSTQKTAVQENLNKVVEGFFTSEETALLLEQILAVYQQSQPSIESIVLMLLEAYNRHKADKVGHYLPLHNYLVNHRTFMGNFIELLKLLALDPDRESEILRCFVGNLDLIEESNRCITPQRFLSSCIKCNLPTITDMCGMLVANIQRCQPPEFFSRKVYVQVAEQNIGWLLKVKEDWQLPIQNSLLQQLESALQLEDKHLTQFWWLVTVASMLDKHIQDLINRVIGNLNIVTIEDYFNQLKKPK